MSIDISKLDNKQLAMLCIKHNIISKENLSNHTKEQVIQKVEHWCAQKKQKYQGQKKAVTVNENKPQGRQRRNSSPQVTQVKNRKGPPKPTIVHRERRMSEPLTPKEKTNAQNNSQLKQQ